MYVEVCTHRGFRYICTLVPLIVYRKSHLLLCRSLQINVYNVSRSIPYCLVDYFQYSIFAVLPKVTNFCFKNKKQNNKVT